MRSHWFCEAKLRVMPNVQNSKHKSKWEMTNQPTNFTDQSPSWEANISSACQEILSILWKANVFTVLTRARHVSLTWVRSIQSTPLPYYSFNIHFKITLPPMSSKCARPSGSPTKTLIAPLLYPTLITFPAHYTLFYLIIWIINKKWVSRKLFLSVWLPNDA
jgi:hypothetical protein